MRQQMLMRKCILAGTELLQKPLNPAPQDASSYPMKVQALAQPKEALDAAAAAKAQQTPEERAAALAAAEKAVEDISLSVGGALPHSAEALAPAAEEGGTGAEEKTAEPGEVSSPRATAAETSAAMPTQPEQALQPDSAATADDAAQPMQIDAEAPQEGPVAKGQGNLAAAQPAEAPAVAVPATTSTADDGAADQTVPDAPAVKAADDAAEPEPDRAAAASPKRKAAAEPVLKQASDVPVAAAEAAASGQGASAEQAGSKKLKATAAEPEAPAEMAEAGAADPAPQVHADSVAGDTVPRPEAAAAAAPEPSAVEKPEAAEPKSTRKRKNPPADSEATHLAAETSNSPESQPSKSLSGRTTRSRQAVLGSAAAGQGADAVAGEPAARQVAEQPAKPRSRARAAGSSEPAHNQAGATPAISPNSSNERSISRRSLRSQAEPGSTPPHKQEQAGPAVKSTLRRASRSRSSMQREDRGSPRGDSAAAAHEAAGPVLGSRQPELPATRAAVQALLNGPTSSRRRTRSDTQEHTLVAAGASRLDLAPSGRSAAVSGELHPLCARGCTVMPFVTHVRRSAVVRSCPRYSASQQESALMGAT